MKKINKRELRAISRDVPEDFEKREFIESKNIQGDLEEAPTQAVADELFKSLSELENDFETIMQRLKLTLPSVSITTEQFDESTIQCISNIFGSVETVNGDMYLKMLDLQLSLANQIAIEELEKQEII